MSKFFNKRTLCASAAIFSMFFGAGNSVFPIKLGLAAGNQLPYALLGLLITGIGGPLMGLLTALRYKGDSRLFFSRWGAIPGSLFLALSLILLGPFCVLPRCYIVAHAALTSLLPGISPLYFFGGFSILSLACTLRKQSLLSLLGYLLAPLLLISLIAIIVMGISNGEALLGETEIASVALVKGISAGYDTMDLIAAIIFSGSIWTLLNSYHNDEAKLYSMAWRSSILGGVLLGLVYCGLAVATSLSADKLGDIPPEALLTTLATVTLGPKLGGIANIAMILACFTTIVSLTYAIARICRTEIFSGQVSESKIIIVMTMLTTCFANFGFSAIQGILHPIVSIAYPVIIVLTISNLWHSYRLHRNVGATT